MEQIDIFEMANNYFKLNNDIFLVEFFGGIGSQYKALKNIGYNIVKSRLYEVDMDASISYAAIHHDLNTVLDNNETREKEYYLKELKPYTIWKNEKDYDITKLKIEKLKTLYYAIKLSNNHTNIFELEVEELDKKIYEARKRNVSTIITWSTPCQEFSMAGNRGGFDTYKGSLTKISLDIFEALENKPEVLMFENVPGIKSGEFIVGFNEMVSKLHKIGYENHILELNAKDFGVPQNRERVFIVSILKSELKDGNLKFPKKKILDIFLRDLLEDNVDNKYFLSQEQIDKLIFRIEEHKEKGRSFEFKPIEKDGVSNTVLTQYRSATTDNWLLEENELNKIGYIEKDMVERRVYDDKVAASVTCNSSMNSMYAVEDDEQLFINTEASDKIMKDKSRIRESETTATIRTKVGCGDERLLIRSNNLQGYEEAEEGDGIYINRPHQKRGVVQSKKTPTIKTSPDIGVLLWNNGRYNIRKLTPLECWRLMGFTTNDYDNASLHQSQTALYKQAGNSIVVNVIEEIFKCMKGE